jgi:hypothetical protein
VKLTIHTPATVAEAIDRLTGIERLLMSKGWERAAVLATIVRLDNRAGRKPNRWNPTDYLTPGDLARKRIPGLLDPAVIRLYVQRWLDTHDGVYPDPDTEVELPVGPWPPTTPEADDRTTGVTDAEAIKEQATADGTGASKALDIAKNPRAMAAAIKASPQVAAAAAQALEARASKAAAEEAAKAGEAPFDTPPPIPEVDTLRMAIRGMLGTAGGHAQALMIRLRDHPEYVPDDYDARHVKAIQESWSMIGAVLTGATDADFDALLTEVGE